MVVEAVKKSIWKVGTRRVGRPFLAKALEYYKFNASDRRNFVAAYNKYMNALNNTTNAKARSNAKAAAVKFVNTAFKTYEKRTSNRSDPVGAGISNGVQQSLVYWLPGILARRALGIRGAKPKSAPKRLMRSRSV